MKNELKQLFNQYTPDSYIVLDICESKNSEYIYIAPEELAGMTVDEDDYRVYKFRISNHDAMTGRSMMNNGEVVLNYFNEFGYEINLDMFGLNDSSEFTYKPKDTDVSNDTFFTRDQVWVYRQIAIYFASKIN